jgi:hypothetical protein
MDSKAVQGRQIRNPAGKSLPLVWSPAWIHACLRYLPDLFSRKCPAREHTRSWESELVTGFARRGISWSEVNVLVSQLFGAPHQKVLIHQEAKAWVS